MVSNYTKMLVAGGKAPAVSEAPIYTNKDGTKTRVSGYTLQMVKNNGGKAAELSVKGLQSGVDEMYDFFGQMSSDYESRKGKYQKSDDYSKYAADATRRADSYLRKIDAYKVFLDDNKDYFGKDKYEELSGLLAGYGENLSNIKNSLAAEREYWASVPNEAVWKYHNSANDEEREAYYNGLKAKRADVQRQIDEKKNARVPFSEAPGAGRAAISPKIKKGLLTTGDDNEIKDLEKQADELDAQIAYFDTQNKYQAAMNYDIEAAKEKIAEIEKKQENVEYDSFVDPYDESTVTWAGLEKEKTKLQNEIDEAEFAQGYADYLKLKDNDDFAERSRYVPTGKGDTQYIDSWREDEGVTSKEKIVLRSGFDDVLIDMVNGNPTAWREYEATPDYDKLWAFGLTEEYIRQMTDTEKGIFNYLLHNPDKTPEEAKADAMAFLKFMQGKLNQRQRAEEMETAAGIAKVAPVIASVGSVLLSPLKVVSRLGQIIDYYDDHKVDQNAGYNRFSYLNTAARRAVSEKIEENYGAPGSFLYQTGMSMADFLYTTGITGGQEWLSLGIMGSSAAADTLIDLKDQGAPDGQAFLLSTVAGLAEVVTEKVSLEALLDHSSLTKSAFGYWLKNTIAEGSEEVASDLINLFADIMVRGDESEWRQSIERYKKIGYDDNKAFAKAFGDKLAEVSLSGLGGAISGAALATAPAIRQGYLNTRINVDNLIDIAMTAPENSRAYKLAQEAANKLKAGQSLEMGEILKLSNAVKEDVSKTRLGREPWQPAKAIELEARERAAKAETTLEKTGILNGVPEHIIERAKRLSRLLKVNIEFFTELPDGNGTLNNGEYDRGSDTIRINALASNPIEQVLLHELTHRIESSPAYGELSDTVLSYLRKTGRLEEYTESIRRTYEKHGVELDDVGLNKDIVARFIEENLLPASYDIETGTKYDGISEAALIKLMRGKPRLLSLISQKINGLFGAAGSVSAQNRAFLVAAQRIYSDALSGVQTSFTEETRPDTNENRAKTRDEADAKDAGKKTKKEAAREAAKKRDAERTNRLAEIEEDREKILSDPELTEEERDDILDLLEKEEEELRGEEEAKREGGKAYSIVEIEGEKGTYGKGVLLDTDFFKGVNTNKWGNRLREYIENDLAGKDLVMYDENGNEEIVYVAKKNDRVRKDGAKNTHPVLGELAYGTKKIKDEKNGIAKVRAKAILQLPEVLSTSKEIGYTNEHSHQWLDEKGWRIRKTYFEERDGVIYEAKLKIADGRDRKIIYQISEIVPIDKKSSGENTTTNKMSASLSPGNKGGSFSTQNNDNYTTKNNKVKQYSITRTDEKQADALSAVKDYLAGKMSRAELQKTIKTIDGADGRVDYAGERAYNKDGAAKIIRAAHERGISVDEYLRENAELFEGENGEYNDTARKALDRERNVQYSISDDEKGNIVDLLSKGKRTGSNAFNNLSMLFNVVTSPETCNFYLDVAEESYKKGHITEDELLTLRRTGRQKLRAINSEGRVVQHNIVDSSQDVSKEIYEKYLSPEARAKWATDPKFKKWAHKDLAFITAAAWNGVVIPYETLKEIPEIREAQKRSMKTGSSLEDAKARLGIKAFEDRQDGFVNRLLSQENGSAVFENGKIKKKENGTDDYSGEVRREHKAFIVIGPPAAGKSSVFADPLSNKHKARIIDSDMVKPWLDGYDEGYGAGYVQDESAEIASLAITRAIKDGENIVIPRIGGNSVIELARELKGAGYSVSLYFNEVSQETSIMRAASRFAEKGRFLNLEYLTTIGNRPKNTFINNAEGGLFDYAEWRNNEVGFNEKPRLVWNSEQGRHLEPKSSGDKGNDRGDDKRGRRTNRLQEARGVSEKARSAVKEKTKETQRSVVDLNENSLSPREFLRTKEKNQLRAAETEFLSRIRGDLGAVRFIDKTALRETVREISDAYFENGEISNELENRLFKEAYDRAVAERDSFFEEHRKIREHLRKSTLKISEADRRGNWRNDEDWHDLKIRARGLFKLSTTEGLPVDVAYMELHEMDPELFPEDIINIAEQVDRIYEVANAIRPSDEMIADKYGTKGEYPDAAWKAFDDSLKEFEKKLKNIKRVADEQKEKAISDVQTGQTSVEEMEKLYEERKKARREYEKTIAKIALTDEDKRQVDRLIRGDITPDMLDKDKNNVEGIIKAAEVKKKYRELDDACERYKKSVRALRLRRAEELLADVADFKDKKIGLLYARETPERNIEDVAPDKKTAKILIDEYITPVHDAEAESNRFKNKYRDAVRKLELSRKVAPGNTVSEAHAVQLYGEASDYIEILKNRNKNARHEGKTLSEWQHVIDELWKDNPNLDKNKIENAVKEFREIYDTFFKMMNETRIRNGYEPVSYRKGYFPHFQPDRSDGMLASFGGKLLGIKTDVTELPTTITGTTHLFRPGITWFGNALERIGFSTAYDAVEGFDKYVEGVARVIFQTDNLQKLRALAHEIRYLSSDDGIRQQIDKITDDNSLSEEEKQALINEVWQKARYQLSNFVVWLDDYTNVIANKKTSLDRSTESMMGRKMYNLGKALSSRVGFNMVAGNLSSALTNFIPLVQANAQLGPAQMLRGMWETLQALKTDDGIIDMSTFLTNRRGSDPIIRSTMDKVGNRLGSVMEHIDHFTAGSIVRARYEANLKDGMEAAEAMREADSFAARIMAARSVGAMPTLFTAKSPAIKFVTQFQLEVNNQFSEVFKDLPKIYRDKGLAAFMAVLLRYFIGSFLFNELYESIVGRRPALDPLGIINDTVGDLTGYELPNLVELAAGTVGIGEKQSFKTKKKGLLKAGTNLVENVVEELPFSSAAALVLNSAGTGIEVQGGRIPVASAIPDLSELWKTAATPKMDWKVRLNKIAAEVLKPILHVALPFGGNQLQKTWKGMRAFIAGGSYKYDNEGRKQLQYPVYKDDPWKAAGNALRLALFGKSSISTARDWVDNDFDTLSVKKTLAYCDMRDIGIKDEDAYALVKEVGDARAIGTQSKADVQRGILRDSKVAVGGKAIAYYSLVASDSEREFMDDMDDAGIGKGKIYDIVTECAGQDKSGKVSVLKKHCDGMSAEQIKAAAGPVMGRDLKTENGNLSDYGKFCAMIDTGLPAKEALQFKIDDMSYDKYLSFTEAGIKPQASKDIVYSLARIMPDEGKTQVSTAQKMRAVLDTVNDEKSQIAALKVVGSDKDYQILTVAKDNKISYDAVVTLKERLPNFDYNHSGTYNGEELEDAIDALDGGTLNYVLPGGGKHVFKLTNYQKGVLWQLFSASKSAKNNPFSQSAGEAVLRAKK